MSSETLSQHDIDRLLGGGSRQSPTAAAAMDVQVYDFRRPHRVSKERLRTLEAMYERLVKGLEAWLISRVRGQIEVRLQSVEQFSFGEFTLSLPMPCSSFIFDITGTGQKGVIDVGPEFSTYIIDRLFGGEGTGSALTRALTPIERMAVRSVADKVSGLLQEIWQDHVAMDLNITGFESSPEILQVVNREDPVLVANVEFTTGNVSSLLLICLPFSVLDKFFTSSGQQRNALLTTSDQERETTRLRSETALRATKVPLTARLPDFQLSMRDIAGITEGTIIPTGIPTDARVIVRAGTQERFIGHPGRVSGNLAVRILDAVPSATTSDPRTTSA
ncbi:FliM/FliN family flagellar motor switch protein [Gemmatimonas sp.]|uniref:flagellar motor switch protein FliM n=1 Tax=Gemmatimonas sp. TaxID=1962908 RepID=UPI00286E3ED4|nr:FliM/FliN family flagellar motor switch protein [Gemmatimonas sp.]